MLFTLILEADDMSAYRAGLRDLTHNRIVWRSQRLLSKSVAGKRVVSFAVAGNLLQKQHYLFELTGISPGKEELASTYAFTVDRK